MAKYYFLCMCLLRIALPICLTLSIVFRPSLLSAMYLLLLLYLPVVPVPTTRSMSGHTGCYLKIVICISFLTSISQLAFQIVLLSLPPYAHFLKNCEFLERILRHVGFIRLNELSAKDVVQWLSPEIVMLFTSIAIYMLCRRLTVKTPVRNSQAANEEGEAVDGDKKSKKKTYGFLMVLGKYLALISLAVAACLRPSVPGALYFLVFLGGATWWSCYKELRKAFAYVCRFVLVVLFFHICTLYGYQFQWPQEYLDQNSTYARLIGLTPIMSVDCEDPRSFIFNDLEWTSYLNPIVLLWLYYVLALESKLLLMPQVISESFQTSERTALIRGVSPSRKYGTGSGRSILQDSTGSVTITGEGQDDIPMQQLGTAEEELQTSLFDNIVFGIASISQVLIRSSYIVTNISMMAWSITYHSWLTFVLLLWANLLWLLPNQRRAMLRSSPFLVFYAEFLLLSAYIYSMNLTEEELPSVIGSINLQQIGFEKILHLPCHPLLVKCLFTTMFWITLRQFMQERQEARQTSALADMVAPLQVTVGTATSAMQKEEETQGNQFMKTLGEYLKKFLTKFWIWVVVINLFVVAITGERMTGFRIIYMYLFLIFIVSFQLSFRLWRRIMYSFWVTVIGYSMITLVLVYTYQFHNFPSYWTKYLHIPPEQQLDIGLEKYETKQLFVRLLTPTFFVVITVVQLHYFHKDFLEISDIRSRRSSLAPETDPRSEASSAQGGPWDPESERSETITAEIPNVTLKGLRDKDRLITLFKYIWHKIVKWSNYLWLYLELHICKITLLVAMLLTVYDTCAIHFGIMLIAVTAIPLGRRAQTIAIHLCSVIVSSMLISRMIYQIKYINHSKWDVYCDNTTVIITNSTHYNNAEWLGFRKIDRGRALPSLVKWYIGFILIVTIRAIIEIRQRIWRISQGKPTTRPFFMFPKVTRADADKSVQQCLMYLTNFGFYKFGVEVSLMATVALIGTRMDFYACLHGFWLVAMCMVERNTLSKIWNWYLAFIVFVLPLQYFMVIGLPPGLCIVFPWDIEGEDERLRRMQDWMFLLDIKYPPSAHKLICDIFVLILVARQSVVFRIEKRYEGTTPPYPGGSNLSIIHEVEDPDFVNPVPDFVTYIRSWLDILKRGILQSFMWITLAIVFLAGTNRVNFFSLGYLVGSFIFLWQGSDLYLRPIPKILKSWNWLLGYNVFVIIVKTILQIWGCIFIDDVAACWLLRLLGIGCIKKFGHSPLLAGLPEPSQCPPVPREDIGLAWDGLCFGFLIMQRRLFNSFNFFHIIDETKATTILASRGAELMEELRDKQMAQKAEQENKILEKIKLKMDRIKATQQRIQGPSFQDPTNHFVEAAPIARSPSLSSCTSTSATSEHTAEAGYHTPIDEDEADEDPAPLTPRAGSLLQTQAPTPCSALMTVSLDGYLEPQRMSFGSPPNSDLNHRAPSLDESFPVFSPPPYDAAVGEQRPAVQRQTSIGPPWMQGSFVTPRQSIISYSSRSPQSHHTYKIFPDSRPLKPNKVPTSYKAAIRSGDYYMFDDLDDEELDLIAEKDDDEDDDQLGEDKLTVGRFLSITMKSNVDMVRRRTSAPEVVLRRLTLARQRSYVSSRSHLSAPLPLPRGSDKESPRTSQRGPSVTIKEVKIDERDEPKPGGSKELPEDEMSLLSEVIEEESKTRKVINLLLFVWIFIESLMNTATNYLNRFSRDYKYVLRVLSKEKKLLKEKTNFRIGVRRASTQVWEPSGSFQSLIKQTSEDSADTTASVGDMSPPDSYRRALCAGRSSQADDGETVEYDRQPSSLEPIIPPEKYVTQAYASEYDRRKASVLTVPEIRILAPSLERGLDSSPRSQSPVDIMVDYETAEMSSIDQPPIVRLMHSIWFAILSHSDVVCYFMIFLNQIKSASLLSLPLPLMVFLWGTLTIPRPSKTFWITIIAYTEVIVLIKCVFQFKILDDVATTSNPFHPPRIIGIERTSHYATYDLLLLLVVFFHRLMLKTLGLWKTSVEPSVALEEGLYRYEEEDDDDTYTPRDKSGRRFKSEDVHFNPLFLSDLNISPYTPEPGRRSTARRLTAEMAIQTEDVGPVKKIAKLAQKVVRFLTAEYHELSTLPLTTIPNKQDAEVQTSDVSLAFDAEDGAPDETSVSHESIELGLSRTDMRDSQKMDGEPSRARTDMRDSQKMDDDPSRAETKSRDKPSHHFSVAFQEPEQYWREKRQKEASRKSGALRLTSVSVSRKGEPPDDPDDKRDEMIDSEDHTLVKLTSKEVPTLSQMPGALKLAMEKYLESVKKFFLHLLDPTSRITADVYAYMFMCDFFNFMVVIFGFAAFGTQQGDGGVSAYLQENKVPIPFLLMLVLQFILIIVDRALFLRKYILGKIVFQFLQIVGVHISMFFILPAVTERNFNALLPPQMWYMVKCFYLLLSAYQIRCGYPTRILGNFLCKGYNYVNMFLFKGFMAVPFLFELRTIMDWMWTDTSMTIFDWLKMEDIFAHIFQLKCTRHVETEYPQPRGEKKNVIIKYIMGGACLFAIIAVIWFPLVFFALGNTVGEANIPYDVTVNVRIGPYQPIYSMSAQTNAIHGFSKEQFNIMNNNYKKNRVALTFLSSYSHEDVAAVILNGNSTMVWAISPPDIKRMLLEIESDKEIVLRLQYVISRTSNNKQDSGIISSEIEVKMPAKIHGEINPERIKLADMLKGNETTLPVYVERIFPKFVKVTNRAIATPVTQLMTYGTTDAEKSLRNLKMRLSRSEPTPTQSSLMWWELKEDCTDKNYVQIISKIPRQNCEYLVMYTFNEKSFPASLSFLSGGGIIGLYTTLVFVASRMIRGFFSEICFKIMFDDMPNVDRILQLCLDIYLVREARELCLEEDLFAKLVFLFRSPETLIKWTRPKEEDENEGDDPDDEPQQPALAH